jgi:predicted regulator of Ras-like GTPase activity (Roadblock/LC7/MglB family)/tetratricopeptide (TPR) repeat protein
MTEVWGVLTADLQGAVLETTAGSRDQAEQKSSAMAAAVNAFKEAGAAAGFGRLELLLVKGTKKASLAAVRPEAFLLLALDPTKATGQLEKTLLAWTAEGAVEDAASPAPAPQHEALAIEPTTAASSPLAPSDPDPVPIEFVPVPPAPAEVVPAPAEPTTQAPAAAAGGARRAADDPWAALRRALVRGQLTKASVHQRELAEPSRAGPEIPGSETLSPAEHERAMQVLLEGIGTVIAGDGIGGSRILKELTATSQRNLSIRWLALQWSASAALRSGSASVARTHVKEALTIARQLDIDARAVSQWTAAEVLAQGGDHARALTWLTEARARFERLGDRWGLGRTWLAEARLMAAAQREPEAADAARKAWDVDPAWDEPPIFLARRALMRGDLPDAEAIVRTLSTPAADRVRALIGAIRGGAVTHADASEFLREHDAPPSAQSVRALQRIADASPGFVQARDALAWMLLKLGHYAEASAIFRALLAQELSPGDRVSVMLGLGCIPAGQQHAGRLEVAPSASADAGEASAAPEPGAAAAAPAQQSSGASNGKNGGPNAVFSGRLSVFALPDLLEFLRSARRTGLLVCSSPAGVGTLRFREGFIAAAGSPGTPRLGDILIRDGKIAPEALERVAARQQTEDSDHLLGEMLTVEGLVDAAAVQQAIREQIELTIRELVRWTDGEFAFNREGESRAAAAGVSVVLDAQAVLLSVFKEMDEATRGLTADVEL